MKRGARVSTAGALGGMLVLLTGCAAAEAPESGPPVIEHVHAVAEAPTDDALLIATHNGVFTVDADGALAGPVGGHDFDAMGFTVAGRTLFASGHPGPSTSPDLGEGNLGIIRSDDGGQTWAPVAFTGVEDFHVLTAGPDGTLYGIGSSGPELLTSVDEGVTWSRGPQLEAVDLAVTDAGIHAATESGLLHSSDGRAGFEALAGAPVLYSVDARADGRLVGVDVEGVLWATDADGAWTTVGVAEGPVQALSAVGAERIVIVDERGVVDIAPDGETVLVPLIRE
ncbi:hypothetical protein M4D51_03730 [Microbacterium sp. p3-SID338]|uniref:F510_1955 family glycosylhydrolase n=1 Tax=Microbacterium sp. p3-SID338 TaxID=2916214 RepID=UPI000C7FC74F|nr:hypothetical protein [Microbacterium sp. p3-SID338]MCT1394828.1 hypothetical protein [Microbacterium sp. p3-SID338]PMC02017.1 hypothetical protein CJ226_15625 [Microbacterium sp. UMB0228]